MNYCHTSNAGQGLPSHRHERPCVKMSWLALSELVLALEVLLLHQKGTAGVWVHMHEAGFLSHWSQAWAMWMSGAVLAQGSLCASPNQVVTGLFLERKNGYSLMCHPCYIIWVTPLPLTYEQSSWLSQSPRLDSLPAAWLVSRRVYKQVVCVYMMPW